MSRMHRATAIDIVDIATTSSADTALAHVMQHGWNLPKKALPETSPHTHPYNLIQPRHLGQSYGENRARFDIAPPPCYLPRPLTGSDARLLLMCSVKAILSSSEYEWYAIPPEYCFVHNKGTDRNTRGAVG